MDQERFTFMNILYTYITIFYVLHIHELRSYSIKSGLIQNITTKMKTCVQCVVEMFVGLGAKRI